MIFPADMTGGLVSSTSLKSTLQPQVTASTALATSASAGFGQETLNNLTQTAVGKIFQVQVLARLEDGTFVTNVAGNALRMLLPQATTVGGTLQMNLLATTPRPTFMLESETDANSTSFSSAAKIINSVLQTAQQSSAPTALAGKAPLLSTPTASTPQIAAAMQDGVEFSGLFYESHLGQWVSGERPLSDLLREPQFLTTQNKEYTEAVTGKAGILDSNQLLQHPDPVTNEAELMKLIQNARTAAGTSSSVGQALNNLLSSRPLPQEADTVIRSTAISSESAQTINQQLNVLEQNKFSWQGELWPGQPMEWEVKEEKNGSEGTGTGDDQGTWSSAVRFELPDLGKISASIVLHGGHLQIRVNTDSVDSAVKLQAHGKELAKALEHAGSPLDSLLIKQDEQA